RSCRPGGARDVARAPGGARRARGAGVGGPRRSAGRGPLLVRAGRGLRADPPGARRRAPLRAAPRRLAGVAGGRPGAAGGRAVRLPSIGGHAKGKLSVIFEGRPHRPGAFHALYWGSALARGARWPRIRKITLATGEPGEEIYQICDLYFDSVEDLQAALTSPERKQSLEDSRTLPAFEGQVKRQVFEVRDFEA